jgi:hypothetical protein
MDKSLLSFQISELLRYMGFVDRSDYLILSWRTFVSNLNSKQFSLGGKL